MQARYEVKCKLVRLLLERQWEGALIREFFLVIDWMMDLPPELASQLSRFVTELEEEHKMEYVSSIERIKLEQKLHEGIGLGKLEGLHEGRQEGESEMLSRLLLRRFGELPQWVQERVKTASRSDIESWFDCAMEAKTLRDVFQNESH
jgi:flagellar biosynthesis/type III secretory pathway protein FliH